MDVKIRKAQQQALRVFAKGAKDFALCGGTALELYYLNHRFSADLDFFSPKYDLSEIDNLLSAFGKSFGRKLKLESEFISNGRAKVRFYTLLIKNSKRPLKIDFVEDVIFKKPTIKKVEGARVYSVEDIYFQKIIAITGSRVEMDEVGREVMQGRGEARDVFDIYMLSKKVKPLRLYLKNTPKQIQRGVVHWYRTFSREELKLALLDLDIYDKKFDAKKMIIYLENEIRHFVKELIE